MYVCIYYAQCIIYITFKNNSFIINPVFKVVLDRLKCVSTKSYEISPVWTLALIITKIFCVVVQDMWYLIGYGTYEVFY